MRITDTERSFGAFLTMTAACILPMFLLGAAMSHASELTNGTVALTLDVNRDGTPYVAGASWCGGGKIVRETEVARGINAWVPENLIDAKGETCAWQPVDNPSFFRAEASRALADGLRMTWVVDLAKEGSLFRTQIRLSNDGTLAKAVEWYPVWIGSWKAPGQCARLRYWRALSFEPEDVDLAGGEKVTLGSRLHSSDNAPKGQNPYWILAGDKGRLFFSLDWCGGWRAEIEKGKKSGTVAFNIVLPPEETQLTLMPGETVAGPVLTVTATKAADDIEARADWMAQRAALGRAFYRGPGPWYPFAYNNWYTTRFDFDGAFLQRQVDHMDPYGFEAFIVDAGWYQAVGQWTPHSAKFEEGQFERIMAAVKDKGTRAGIWSCPQFVKADPSALPPEVDQPPFYRKFIDGYLLDYAGMDFSKFLLDHAAMLRSRYSADWWKYDQDFFTEHTRHGVMKNAIALQNALLAVRKAHPDLYIENCQSGGRMINEFTVLMTQNQWIRDGGNTGPEHARSNFHEALGALEFMPPWTVNRWTNNPDRNNPDDDEFTRTYCRSAMAGTWGLVADLAKITERQRSIILREVRHYRRLNALKNDCRYEVLYPHARAAAAGIVYYNAAGTQAGILLLRWDKPGAFEFPVVLSELKAEGRYCVEDVDQGESSVSSAAALRETGVIAAFSEARNSALLFVSAKP